MEQKELIHKILQEVHKLETYTDSYVSFDSVPLIEIDIALDTTKSIYDLLHEVKRSIIHEQTYSNTSIQTKEVEEAAIDFNALSSEQAETVTIENQESTIEEIIAKPEIERIIEKQEQFQENIPQQENASTQTKDIEASKPTESELVNIASVNTTKPSAVNKTDLGSKLSKKPISNISTAIGINDRFLFIKELFQNNADTYNVAIHTLNSSESFDHALAYIQTNFSWDYESSSVQSFLAIVERRFL